MAPELKKIRQEVDYCFDEFQKITNSKKFKSVFGLLQAGQEISLSKVPQGFEKDNPAGPYLKFKSYIAMKPLSDTVVLSRDLLATASDAFAALQPLVAFINRALVT